MAVLRFKAHASVLHMQQRSTVLLAPEFLWCEI